MGRRWNEPLFMLRAHRQQKTQTVFPKSYSRRVNSFKRERNLRAKQKRNSRQGFLPGAPQRCDPPKALDRSQSASRGLLKVFNEKQFAKWCKKSNRLLINRKKKKKKKKKKREKNYFLLAFLVVGLKRDPIVSHTKSYKQEQLFWKITR